MCTALAPAARISVLVTLQDSFLGQAQLGSEIGELARRWSAMTIGDLSATALRAAIIEPVARIGTVRYERGLVERILDELSRAPSPLPLVQFTLAELWERRSGGQLTHSAYEVMGGVQRVLSGYAEGVWTALDAETRDAAQRLLVQLIQPLPGKGLCARRSDLDESQWTAAQRLATTRLLVLHEVEPGGQVPRVRQDLRTVLDCLVLYDTEQERVQFARRLNGLPFGAVPKVSIDPAEQVFGVLTPDSVALTGRAPTENTVQFWDMNPDNCASNCACTDAAPLMRSR